MVRSHSAQLAGAPAIQLKGHALNVRRRNVRGRTRIAIPIHSISANCNSKPMMKEEGVTGAAVQFGPGVGVWVDGE